MHIIISHTHVINELTCLKGIIFKTKKLKNVMKHKNEEFSSGRDDSDKLQLQIDRKHFN